MKIPTQEQLRAAEELVTLVDLEYKTRTVLTTFGDRECATYLRENYQRLLPSLVLACVDNNEEPDVVVKRFVEGVHKRHTENGSLT